jgi:thiamine biosynthesis lipoprotein
MACRCEAIVAAQSVAAATHAAEAALDEIARVDALLSRFDPASEIARINRDATGGPVTVDREVFALLSRCVDAHRHTAGAFDITTGAPAPGAVSRLLSVNRTVRFGDDGIQLDLGGCGKGYALDCAAGLLRSVGVTNACLQVGTSSVVGLGSAPDGNGWPIALVDPRDRNVEVSQIRLMDQALSTSAVNDTVDIRDPRTGRPVMGPQSCTAVARSAFSAEIWSTAGLILGRDGLRELHDPGPEPWEEVSWLAEENG